MTVNVFKIPTPPSVMPLKVVCPTELFAPPQKPGHYSGSVEPTGNSVGIHFKEQAADSPLRELPSRF